jgi:hypothetical protein
MTAAAEAEYMLLLPYGGFTLIGGGGQRGGRDGAPTVEHEHGGVIKLTVTAGCKVEKSPLSLTCLFGFRLCRRGERSPIVSSAGAIPPHLRLC